MRHHEREAQRYEHDEEFRWNYDRFVEALERLGNSYVHAYRNGFYARRLFLSDDEEGIAANSQNPVLTLIDVVFQSTPIALNAYKGMARSSEPDDRLIVAQALHALHEVFPLEATELLSELRDDPSQEVIDAAKHTQAYIERFGDTTHG